jgi:hypothetical protein
VFHTPAGDLYIELPPEAQALEDEVGAALVRVRTNLPKGTWVHYTYNLAEGGSEGSSEQVQADWLGVIVFDGGLCRSGEPPSGFLLRLTVHPHPRGPRWQFHGPNALPPAEQPAALIDMTGEEFQDVSGSVVTTAHGVTLMVAQKQYVWPPGVCPQVDST